MLPQVVVINRSLGKMLPLAGILLYTLEERTVRNWAPGSPLGGHAKAGGVVEAVRRHWQALLSPLSLIVLSWLFRRQDCMCRLVYSLLNQSRAISAIRSSCTGAGVRRGAYGMCPGCGTLWARLCATMLHIIQERGTVISSAHIL
jgi:hypothetical protein